ncbi:LOW QUALITY PROTEIN: hypothetical protein CVT25_015690 [Psilocybe cyanescens]|uniref:F-box domain-containing protein n=1 Tax=Psilocybe cyanescens TaxID=93625 RepID=A0A409XJN2_PSICY|nr:LOW QUALITY PROTEIN: hypothetical protein CVT25_015690 [Psilocybe cyanescens]
MADVWIVPALNARKTSSPISKFNEDILWFIFMIISMSVQNKGRKSRSSRYPLLPYEEALCHQWRHIILKTSSIWDASWTGAHWISKPIIGRMRCGGTSLLWVKGYIPDKISSYISRYRIQSFFQQLVIEKWELIERLSPLFVQKKFVEGVQSVLQRKAPDLQVIGFPHFLHTGCNFQGSLFFSHAPQLRIFRAMQTRCDLDPVWMSSVRELCLDGRFNNKEICNVLAHMPRLESLEVNHNNIIDRYHPPRIRLPNLRTLIDAWFTCVTSIQLLGVH